jgi:sugar lactone lactonase YvrE
MKDGLLVLGTDVGAFAADADHPGHWSRVGGGLPNAPINNLTVAPDGSIVAATHGRGIWTIKP